MTKYIFVTGGVVSGLGKGITAASLGRLLKSRGLKVAAQKLDPYINVDPGTMSPFQHGEVFVTEDGAETDLDLGHYERFIDEDLNQFSNLTTGKVYWNVLNKERMADVGSLLSAVAFYDVKRYGLPFFQRAETVCLNGRIMNEYVLSLIGRDEATALFCVEPFYLTSVHKLIIPPVFW